MNTTAWLIECGSPASYYCGPAEWCSHATHAKRFPTEELAREVAATMTTMEPVRVCEHQWQGEARPSIADLLDEDEFNTVLLGRLGRILHDTANALKGPPDKLAMHSTHDLAKVARKLVSTLADARDELRRYIDLMHKLDYREYAKPVEEKAAAIDALIHWMPAGVCPTCKWPDRAHALGCPESGGK